MSTTPPPIHLPPAQSTPGRGEHRFETKKERWQWIGKNTLKCLGIQTVGSISIGCLIYAIGWWDFSFSDSIGLGIIISMAVAFLLAGIVGPGRFFRWFPIQISRPKIGGVEPFTPLEIEGFIDHDHETDEIEIFLNGEYIGSVGVSERFFYASVDVSDIPHQVINKIRVSFKDTETGDIHTDSIEFARMEKDAVLSAAQEAELSALRTPQQAYQIYDSKKPRHDYGAYSISFILSGIVLLFLIILLASFGS